MGVRRRKSIETRTGTRVNLTKAEQDKFDNMLITFALVFNRVEWIDGVPYLRLDGRMFSKK